MFSRLACSLLKRDTVRRLFNDRVVIVDYPLNPAPRWRDDNAALTALLDRQRTTFRSSIAGMTAALPIAGTIAPDF